MTKTVILWSGAVTGNDYEYRKFNTIGFDEVLITIVPTVQSGRTLSYSIRGYPDCANALTYTMPIKTDGTIASGLIAKLRVEDAFDAIDVGVKNTTTNLSCTVTVTCGGKRR